MKVFEEDANRVNVMHGLELNSIQGGTILLVVELKVQSRGPTQVSYTGQKTFLPLGEMDFEQTLKLVLHHPPNPPENFSYLYATSSITSIERN